MVNASFVQEVVSVFLWANISFVDLDVLFRHETSSLSPEHVSDLILSSWVRIDQVVEVLSGHIESSGVEFASEVFDSHEVLLSVVPVSQHVLQSLLSSLYRLFGSLDIQSKVKALFEARNSILFSIYELTSLVVGLEVKLDVDCLCPLGLLLLLALSADLMVHHVHSIDLILEVLDEVRAIWQQMLVLVWLVGIQKIRSCIWGIVVLITNPIELSDIILKLFVVLVLFDGLLQWLGDSWKENMAIRSE